MILPLADALQNCLQNLTSRIAGVDNEQMTSRVMGMGAMLGFGLGAIKEQFKTPSSNSNSSTNSNSTDNSAGGLKDFVSRAKSIINPNMNLSDEKDYNGNVNPIRDVIKTSKTSNVSNSQGVTSANSTNKQSSANEKKYTPKSMAKSIVKTGFNATKTYLDIGAKMAEGDFSKSSYNYKGKNNTTRKNNLQNNEYINKIANNNKELEKLGDDNEFKGKS